MNTAIPGGLGAILLAGGRANRVGGAVKPLFDVGGRTLLRAAVDAAASVGAHPLTVVGAVLDRSLPVTWVREDPPFGGPAAAVVTALGSWPLGDTPSWTILLACDLPGAVGAVAHLMSEQPLVSPAEDGLCLVDGSGRSQWLIGAYRTAALRTAAAALPQGARDLPLRSLLAPLSLRPVVAHEDLSRDVDTWEDLHEARRSARPTSTISLPEECS